MQREIAHSKIFHAEEENNDEFRMSNDERPSGRFRISSLLRPSSFVLLSFFRWLVAKIWRQSFLHRGYGFASSRSIIRDLIPTNLSDAEIFRAWMCEVKAAHARRGMHRERFGQLDVDLAFRIKQIKQRSFFCMIRTSWITRRWPDAAIFFTDKIDIGQVFVATKTPRDSRLLVQIFGKRFRQAVGQR